MNSRERVRLAINFKEPDRIPVDWASANVNGIHRVAYNNLLNYLGIHEDDIRDVDVVQGLVAPSEEILKRFQVDTRSIFANAASNWKYEPDENGNWYDENGTYYVKSENYCDFREYPLADATSISDLRNFKMNDPTDAARFAGIREKAKYLYENTEYALVGGDLASIYYIAWALRGYENFLLDTASDEEFSNYLMDMIVDWWEAFMDCYLKEIGEYLDIMWAGDDWGSQYGPLIQPEDFRKNVVPRFKRLIRFMKDRCDAKVAYHSCGSVMWCLDDFVEMGVDIIQPLQANAKDMDAKKIKERCRNRLVIHGGLDNQGLFHGAKEPLVEDIKEKISIFAPEGGYLFAAGHNIQANCPPENICAIFDTHKKYCNYPINVD